MKNIRICLVLFLTLFASNGFSAEDFVFHCVEDERTPIWSSFTVIPVLPANGIGAYVDKERRYQLLYIPKGERLPRLIDLTRSSIDNEERSFTVTGKIKIPGEKVQRLKSYLREGSDEAFFMENNPDKVEVAFSLKFKIDNITSVNADDEEDFGVFSYELRLSDEIRVPVVSSNRRFRPYCIGGRKVIENG